MRIFSYIMLLVILLLGITFAVLNPGTVAINYYLGEKSLPLSLLLVFIFAIGCILGLAISFWLVLKTKVKNYHLSNKLKNFEKEVQNLRVMPVQDRH